MLLQDPAHHTVSPATMEKALIRGLEARASGIVQVEVSRSMERSAGNGTIAHAHMEKTASAGMFVKPVLRQVSLGRAIKPQVMIAQVLGVGHGFSESEGPVLSSASWGSSWVMQDFIAAHNSVVKSQKHNFEGCKIPVPTAVRYDRIREALGDSITPKEEQVLCLLKFGMPIDCKVSYGIKKPQKNHFSAHNFKEEVSLYFFKSVQSKALLGPFKVSPITDLCFSPLMTVPKEKSK